MLSTEEQGGMMDRIDYEYTMELQDEACVRGCSVAQVVMLRIERTLEWQKNMSYLRGYLWVY